MTTHRAVVNSTFLNSAQRRLSSTLATVSVIELAYQPLLPVSVNNLIFICVSMISFASAFKSLPWGNFLPQMLYTTCDKNIRSQFFPWASCGGSNRVPINNWKCHNISMNKRWLDLASCWWCAGMTIEDRSANVRRPNCLNLMGLQGSCGGYNQVWWQLPQCEMGGSMVLPAVTMVGWK